MRCADCSLAELTMRALGFNDDILWSKIDGSPNDIEHCSDGQRESDAERVAGYRSYCGRYANELRWVQASNRTLAIAIQRQAVSSAELERLRGSADVQVIWMAHPVMSNDVTGTLEQNVARAQRWLRWATSLTREQLGKLGVEFARPYFFAPWLGNVLSGHTATADDDPATRAVILRADCALAARCDEVWLLGGHVSGGMRAEANAARRVRDFTRLGIEPPEEF